MATNSWVVSVEDQSIVVRSAASTCVKDYISIEIATEAPAPALVRLTRDQAKQLIDYLQRAI